MALDFPNNPVNGQKYPDPAVVGLPQWEYNGTKRVWTSSGYGAGIFDPIRAEFDEYHLQVRFVGPQYSPRARNEFIAYNRNPNGTLTEIDAPDSNVGSNGVFGGQLSIEGWPISFDNRGGVTGVIPSPVDITFPAESNAAIVIIEQKARVLHNFIRSNAMNNTHLAYYTRVSGQPIAGGKFTWIYPGNNITDEGNTGPIIDRLPYISQLAMGHCPAMTGTDHSGGGAQPGPTLGGLDKPYRYGQDVNNYILAYCEFTPGNTGSPFIRFHHNTRILRSKRSIFDMSTAKMTFYPLIKPPGGAFPGVQSAYGLPDTTGNYQLGRTITDLSDLENSIFGQVTESNSLQEATKDLREEIARLANGIQATIDYDTRLNLSEKTTLVNTLQQLIDLKRAPATGGDLSDNIDFISGEIDRLVYDDPNVMSLAGFVFPFESEFQDPSEIGYNVL